MLSPLMFCMVVNVFASAHFLSYIVFYLRLALGLRYVFPLFPPMDPYCIHLLSMLMWLSVTFWYIFPIHTIYLVLNNIITSMQIYISLSFNTFVSTWFYYSYLFYGWISSKENQFVISLFFLSVKFQIFKDLEFFKLYVCMEVWWFE